MSTFLTRLAAFLTTGQAIGLGATGGQPAGDDVWVWLAASVIVWVLHELKIMPRVRARHRADLRLAVNPPPARPSAPKGKR